MNDEPSQLTSRAMLTPTILEASSTLDMKWALTIRWQDGSETVEIVGDKAAEALGLSGCDLGGCDWPECRCNPKAVLSENILAPDNARFWEAERDVEFAKRVAAEQEASEATNKLFEEIRRYDVTRDQRDEALGALRAIEERADEAITHQQRTVDALRTIRGKARVALSGQPVLSQKILATGWQPIETAPKDRDILVCRAPARWNTSVRWVEWAQQWRDSTSCQFNIPDPTHWRDHLPTPGNEVPSHLMPEPPAGTAA